MQNTDLEVFQDGKPGWFVNGLAVENISIVEGQEMIVGRMKINGYEQSMDNINVGKGIAH